MSSFTTPEGSRTVSKIAQEGEEPATVEPAAPNPLPTPKGDAKWSYANR